MSLFLSTRSKQVHSKQTRIYIWERADGIVEILICQTTLDYLSRTGIPRTPHLCRQGQWLYLEILEWVSPPVYITTTIAPLTHHVSQPGPQRRPARYALTKIQFRINDLTNQLKHSKMPSLPQPAFVTVPLPPPVPQQLSHASCMPWTQQRKSARIASQDNRSSPFLRLHQEIRHMILKMYFVSTAYRYESGHAAANDGFYVSMCGWSSPLHSLSMYCFERSP